MMLNRKNTIKIALGASALMLLSACGLETNQTQRRYTADREECRNYAESTSGTSSNMPSGQEHIVLVSQFARCMNLRGWAVNKPPEEVTAQAKASVIGRRR